MSILHIQSSARIENSNTRIIGQYLIQALKQPVVVRDLTVNPLPSISGEHLMGVHGSADNTTASFQEHLDLSNQLIDELRNADTLVLAAPMYNFGIPATLKQWVDNICRAGVSFKYTAQGPEGLLDVKRAFIITASGGTPIGGEMDFASRYLEHICRFIGITEVNHIEVSGSKGTPEQVLANAKQQVDALVSASTNQ